MGLILRNKKKDSRTFFPSALWPVTGAGTAVDMRPAGWRSHLWCSQLPSWQGRARLGWKGVLAQSVGSSRERGRGRLCSCGPAASVPAPPYLLSQTVGASLMR